MKQPPLAPEKHQEGRLWFIGTRVADPDPHYFEKLDPDLHLGKSSK
jgi:hypothetical protein